MRRDDGSILPLTIFYGVFALVLVLLVVAATSLYLERKRLFTLADGAALAGAESFDLADVTADDGDVHATLEPRDVAVGVHDYLAAVDTAGFESLHVDRATSTDGRSATVELSAYWRPPVVTLFVPEGLRVEVTSVARSVFGEGGGAG